MDCCQSSVHGILQARILEWVAIPFSRGSSWPRDQAQVSWISRQIHYCLSLQGSPVVISCCFFSLNGIRALLHGSPSVSSHWLFHLTSPGVWTPSSSAGGALMRSCCEHHTLQGCWSAAMLKDDSHLLWSLGRGRNISMPAFNPFCCSVTESYLTLCDSMDCSTPGLPVLHCLPEFSQTHVHWFSDDIQPPCPLSSPSPPAFSFSQHQGLFQWVSSSRQVAKVFELQHQSFQWIFWVDFL